MHPASIRVRVRIPVRVRRGAREPASRRRRSLRRATASSASGAKGADSASPSGSANRRLRGRRRRLLGEGLLRFPRGDARRPFRLLAFGCSSGPGPFRRRYQQNSSALLGPPEDFPRPPERLCGTWRVGAGDGRAQLTPLTSTPALTPVALLPENGTSSRRRLCTSRGPGRRPRHCGTCSPYP